MTKKAATAPDLTHLNSQQAERLLPAGDRLHTFLLGSMGLAGADVDRDELLGWIAGATALHRVEGGIYAALQHRLIVEATHGRYAVQTRPEGEIAPDDTSDLDALALTGAARRRAAAVPPRCFHYLDTNPPGQRVVALKRGETGYYQTDLDDAALTPAHARATVVAMNRKLGVTAAEVMAMAAGSLFGWDVPGADVARYRDYNDTHDTAGERLREKAF